MRTGFQVLLCTYSYNSQNCDKEQSTLQMKSRLTLEDENLPAPEVILLAWVSIPLPSFFYSFFSSLFLCSDHSEQVSIQRATITSVTVLERVLISEESQGNVYFEDSIAPALSRQFPPYHNWNPAVGQRRFIFGYAGKKQGERRGISV